MTNACAGDVEGDDGGVGACAVQDGLPDVAADEGEQKGGERKRRAGAAFDPRASWRSASITDDCHLWRKSRDA